MFSRRPNSLAVDHTRYLFPVSIYVAGVPWVAQTGSMFMVERKGRCFAITARHCLGQADIHSNGDYGQWVVLIPEGADQSSSLATDGIHQLEQYSGTEPDDDVNDIVVLEIATRDCLPHHLQRISFLPLRNHVEQPNVGDRMILYGYATCNRTFLIEPPSNHSVITDIDARYETNNGDLTHTVSILNQGNVLAMSSLDGYSGGPIFSVNGNRLLFSGMIVRGGLNPAYSARYIDANVIISFLDLIIEHSKNPL